MNPRLGLIAPKNTEAEMAWLLNMLQGVRAEPYRPSQRYDIVWFLNVTEEIVHLRRFTDSRLFVVAMEPEYRYPPNYDPRLLDLAHRYMGYRDFSSQTQSTAFGVFTFPTYTRSEIRQRFEEAQRVKRIYEFCLFARHDPNIRREIAGKISRYGSFLGGALFEAEIPDKFTVQRQCRYEFITENDLNDYYVSEKLGQSLVAGCIPVYLGGRAVKEFYPPHLFVDMRDFVDHKGGIDLDAVIDHCRNEDVYRAKSRAIRTHARELLVERFSIEACLIEPIQSLIDELRAQNWQSKHRSVRDSVRRLKHRLAAGRK
jgi:hypothetical protein